MFERLRKLFQRRPQPPEYRLQVSSTDVALIDRAGAATTIGWNELGAVVIETNDSGPWGDDVMWHIFAADMVRCLIVPQSVEGDRELLRVLQQIPDFDNAAVVAAMGSTSVDAFLCWEKPSWPGRDLALVAFGRTWRTRHPSA